jgi:hypothetical protein
MAVTRRLKNKLGSRYKKKSTFSTRRAGKYGMYRSTRFAPMRRAAMKLYRGLNPFPNTKMVRHKYCDVVTLAGQNAGVSQYYQFRANCVYDPDFTSTGHQPMFHDQISSQYEYYTVLSSKIRVCFPPGPTEISNFYIWVDDDSTMPSTTIAMSEQHRTHAAIKLDKRQHPLVLKASYDAAKWNKSSRAAILGDDTQKVQKGTSPGNKVVKYYTVVRSPNEPTTALAQMPLYIEIFYYCLWREPIDHPTS